MCFFFLIMITNIKIVLIPTTNYYYYSKNFRRLDYKYQLLFNNKWT